MAYASEKLQTNDPSASEQWAFFNDGSFTSEEVTKYPVYSDPFGQPSENAELLGTLVEVKKRQAVSGVDINLKQAWETYGNGSHDTIVAMIDTGIDASHEDLKDTLWVNTDEIRKTASTMTETATWMIVMGGISTIITIRSSPGMRTATEPTGPGRSVPGQETGSESRESFREPAFG